MTLWQQALVKERSSIVLDSYPTLEGGLTRNCLDYTYPDMPRLVGVGR